jgi:hypothetical protein
VLAEEAEPFGTTVTWMAAHLHDDLTVEPPYLRPPLPHHLWHQPLPLAAPATYRPGSTPPGNHRRSHRAHRPLLWLPLGSDVALALSALPPGLATGLPYLLSYGIDRLTRATK